MTFLKDIMAIVDAYNKASDDQTKKEKLEAFTARLKQEKPSLLDPDPSKPNQFNAFIRALSTKDKTGEFLQQVIECLPEQALTLDHLTSALQFRGELDFIRELIVRLIETDENTGYSIIEDITEIAGNCEYAVEAIVDYCNILQKPTINYSRQLEFEKAVILACKLCMESSFERGSSEYLNKSTYKIIIRNITAAALSVYQTFAIGPDFNLNGAPLAMGFWILEAVLKTKALGKEPALENTKEDIVQLLLGSLILALKLTYEHEHQIDLYCSLFSTRIGENNRSIGYPQSFLIAAECRVMVALHGDLLPDDWGSVLKYEMALMPLHGHAATSTVQFTQPAAQTPTLNNSRSAPAAPQ